jgi:hypothetical protein
MRYRAIKEGWDGRQIRKPGEEFSFSGPRGSWMVPVDEAPESPPRPVRLGSKVNGGGTRDELREQLRSAGIKFHATASAEELAILLKGPETESKDVI